MTTVFDFAAKIFLFFFKPKLQLRIEFWLQNDYLFLNLNSLIFSKKVQQVPVKTLRLFNVAIQI